MNDSIERQAAIDALCSVCGNDCDKTKFIYDAPQQDQVIMCPEHYVLSTLPPAQPERETAKFIRWMECKKTVNYISYTPHCKCSKCGTEFLIETIKYCYMCGARMER